jgi:pyrroloquinoline quinone (PQQ) biosynthesis protein C
MTEGKDRIFARTIHHNFKNQSSTNAVDPAYKKSKLPLQALASKPLHQPNTSTEASDGLARNLVSELMAQSLQHRAVCHPYLRALSTGDLPDPRGALQDFARHYLGYSSHFPRYLTALISRLEDEGDRRALLTNLQEESGSYSSAELRSLQASGIQSDWVVDVPHPELFRRFRRALGVKDDDPAEEQTEVIAWRELLLAVITLGTAAEAVGALGLGTEGIVPAIYPAFMQALRRQGDVAPRDGVFFPLHTLVDDQHQASLQTLARKLAASPRGRRDLTLGMTKALFLRDAFWNWLLGRALAMDPV